MNAYQELAPRFDTYRDTIKDAKAKKGYSLSTLAKESGVATIENKEKASKH